MVALSQCAWIQHHGLELCKFPHAHLQNTLFRIINTDILLWLLRSSVPLAWPGAQDPSTDLAGPSRTHM